MSTSELQEPWTEQPNLKPERVIQVMAPIHNPARGGIGLRQLDFAAVLA